MDLKVSLMDRRPLPSFLLLTANAVCCSVRRSALEENEVPTSSFDEKTSNDSPPQSNKTCWELDRKRFIEIQNI